MSHPVREPVDQIKSPNKLIWFLAILALFGCTAVVTASVLISQFLNRVQGETLQSKTNWTESRVVLKLDNHWSKQLISSQEITIESPSILRSSSSDTDIAEGHETFTGAYPNGCVDAYLMQNSSDEPYTPKSSLQAIQEWIETFEGTEDIEVNPAAFQGIDRSRLVFEARYLHDGYRTVHFVEIVPSGKKTLWLTLHCYQGTSPSAKDDFVRLIQSVNTSKELGANADNRDRR